MDGIKAYLKKKLDEELPGKRLMGKLLLIEK